MSYRFNLGALKIECDTLEEVKVAARAPRLRSVGAGITVRSSKQAVEQATAQPAKFTQHHTQKPAARKANATRMTKRWARARRLAKRNNTTPKHEFAQLGK